MKTETEKMTQLSHFVRVTLSISRWLKPFQIERGKEWKGRFVQMCCGKTLSICISRVANEQNLGDPYQPYQPAIKTLHERIASLAAGSILTSVTWILLELPLEGHTEEKSLEHLSSDHLSLASKGPTCPNQGYWYHPFFIVLVFFFNLYF